MKVFVGYDTREDMAYQVCKHSIERHSPTAEVIPLKQSDLKRQGWYSRSPDKLASTEFTFTRFLVYPRKNWSSMMLINCGHPANKRLNIDLVNEKELNGAYFHRFSWLESDDQIGELSPEWNWLVGHYNEPKDGSPKLLHYTEGGPWFENYRHCQYNQVWKHELQEMMNDE